MNTPLENTGSLNPNQPTPVVTSSAVSSPAAVPVSASTPPSLSPAPKKLPWKGIVSLAVFVLIVVGGAVGLYMTTQQNFDTRQQAQEVPNACTLTFDVPEPAVAIACQKSSFRDEFANSPGNYTLTQPQNTFEPGDIVVFRVTLQNTGSSATQVSLSDVLTGNNLERLTFLDSDCGPNAYNTTTRTLTCAATEVPVGGTQTRIFRARVAANTPASTSIINTATITSGETTASCNVIIATTGVASPSPSPSPSATPTVSPSPTPSITPAVSPSPSASPAISPSPTPVVTPTPVVNASPSPSPTPIVYTCNSACTSNEQCSLISNSYICYNNRCRLENNLNSETCAQPIAATSPTQTPITTGTTTTTTTTVTTVQGQTGAQAQTGTQAQAITQTQTTSPQPSKPKTLPKAGAGDNTSKFILIGGAALLVGVLGFLLL